MCVCVCVCDIVYKIVQNPGYRKCFVLVYPPTANRKQKLTKQNIAVSIKKQEESARERALCQLTECF